MSVMDPIPDGREETTRKLARLAVYDASITCACDAIVLGGMGI